MTVTFLAHSGFLVEWDKFYTLFDYVYDENYTAPLPELDKNKPLLVFSSHKHEDHFDARIFTLLEQYPNTHYYLSRDINLTERRRKWLDISDEAFAHCTILRADTVFLTEAADEELSIRTVKSTDIGVAFLLRCKGKMVYHGGDLNWWHWESEGKAYCNNMAAIYRRAIEKLAACVRDEALDCGCEAIIEAAMAPLDPRLGDAYDMGVEHLLKSVSVRHLFPMHLWEKYDTVTRYCAEHPAHAAQIMPVAHKVQEFVLD